MTDHVATRLRMKLLRLWQLRVQGPGLQTESRSPAVNARSLFADLRGRIGWSRLLTAVMVAAVAASITTAALALPAAGAKRSPIRIDAGLIVGPVPAGATLLGGDCNDSNSSVNPGQLEVVGNLFDDDCDGLADEDANNNPSINMMDVDGDGQPLAQGDCNDTSTTISFGAPETIGNRIDDNCNGVADEDGMGNPPNDNLDNDLDGYSIGPRILFRSGFE